ncbi:MAG TPA: SAM-dependent methyltransferase [Bacillota bacterium]|nr:SAM-dependent methyltransferase [Bacillota bacterium]
MEKLKDLLKDLVTKQELNEAILSNLRMKDPDSYQKIVVKPIELKGERHYQFSFYYSKKVLHENLDGNETESKLLALFEQEFKQGLIHAPTADYQVLISKKQKVTILKKVATKQEVELSHNRQKKYLLEEGKPVPFLVELGVMTPEGKVVAKKYDKFKQINRFVEMIRDIVPELDKGKTLKIIDFGCGKSYLTFALYYYLKELNGFSIEVVGLDLKEDVITHCNRLVKKFGYDQLRFQVGDIADYQEFKEVDMVVTLHACDTATDAALEKAVRWGAKVILSVPCCQHELFRQIQSPILNPMFKHGIIKERISALATDSVRAQLLEILGYKTQILEFIDFEHTPKNLLIRAVKGNTMDRGELVQSYQEMKDFLHLDPYLERALKDLL